ncbi:MAG: hypothetical protein AAB592_05495 [Patescibacteria group bacterium]
MRPMEQDRRPEIFTVTQGVGKPPVRFSLDRVRQCQYECAFEFPSLDEARAALAMVKDEIKEQPSYEKDDTVLWYDLGFGDQVKIHAGRRYSRAPFLVTIELRHTPHDNPGPLALRIVYGARAVLTTLTQ